MKLTDPRWVRAKAWSTRRRAANCSTGVLPGGLDVAMVDGKPRTRGLMRCGDIWACPNCHDSIMARRKESLIEMGDYAFRQGWFVYVVTLTHRHLRTERPLWAREDEDAKVRWLAWRLGEERRALTDAYRKFTGGRSWSAWAQDAGWLAARALEVTHGGHGWHPHFHLFVAVNRKLTDTEWSEIEDRWIESLPEEKRGKKGVALHRFAVSPETLEETTGYLCKRIAHPAEDAAGELAAGTGKRSRVKGDGMPSVTPWQLLGEPDGATCEVPTRELPETLWRAYTLGMLGARALTIPRAVMRALALADVSDLSAAMARDDFQENETLATIGRFAISKIRHAGAWALVDALVNAAREGTLSQPWLDAHWPESLRCDVTLRGSAAPPDTPRIACRLDESWDVARWLARFPAHVA